MSNINLLLNKWSSQIETEVERANQILVTRDQILNLARKCELFKYSISESLKQ